MLCARVCLESGRRKKNESCLRPPLWRHCLSAWSDRLSSSPDLLFLQRAAGHTCHTKKGPLSFPILFLLHSCHPISRGHPSSPLDPPPPLPSVCVYVPELLPGIEFTAAGRKGGRKGKAPHAYKRRRRRKGKEKKRGIWNLSRTGGKVFYWRIKRGGGRRRARRHLALGAKREKKEEGRRTIMISLSRRKRRGGGGGGLNWRMKTRGGSSEAPLHASPLSPLEMLSVVCGRRMYSRSETRARKKGPEKWGMWR